MFILWSTIAAVADLNIAASVPQHYFQAEWLEATLQSQLCLHLRKYPNIWLDKCSTNLPASHAVL